MFLERAEKKKKLDLQLLFIDLIDLGIYLGWFFFFLSIIYIYKVRER